MYCERAGLMKERHRSRPSCGILEQTYPVMEVEQGGFSCGITYNEVYHRPVILQATNHII